MICSVCYCIVVLGFVSGEVVATGRSKADSWLGLRGKTPGKFWDLGILLISENAKISNVAIFRISQFSTFPVFIFLINIDFPVAENAWRKHWGYNQQFYIYNVSDDVYILYDWLICTGFEKFFRSLQWYWALLYGNQISFNEFVVGREMEAAFLFSQELVLKSFYRFSVSNNLIGFQQVGNQFNCHLIDCQSDW